MTRSRLGRATRALAALAILALAGCVSSIEGAYDERAREECDQNTNSSARGACYDRVEQNRRTHQ